METILIGVITSITTKLIKKLNTYLRGTCLEGTGAFILTFLVALIASVLKVFWINETPFVLSTSYKVIAPVFAQIWTVAQLYYTLISKQLDNFKNKSEKEPTSDITSL